MTEIRRDKKGRFLKKPLPKSAQFSKREAFGVSLLTVFLGYLLMMGLSVLAHTVFDHEPVYYFWVLAIMGEVGLISCLGDIYGKKDKEVRLAMWRIEKRYLLFLLFSLAGTVMVLLSQDRIRRSSQWVYLQVFFGRSDIENVFVSVLILGAGVIALARVGMWVNVMQIEKKKK